MNRSLCWLSVHAGREAVTLPGSMERSADVGVEPFVFPLFLEILATLAWAVSGAIVARGRNFDFMGVFVISVLAATGAG